MPDLKRLFALSFRLSLLSGIALAADLNKSAIGAVQGKEARQAEAGGCWFESEGNKGYIFESTDVDRDAWVNVNGQDIKVNKSNKNGLPEKIGGKSSLKYTTKDVEVQMEIKKTAGGEAGSSYTGSMKFTVSGQEATLKITGGCGC